MTTRNEEHPALDTLIASARSTPLGRRGISAIVNAASVDALSAALKTALARGELHAATALALAIGASGGRITREAALWLIPDLGSIEHLPILAGIVDGDRLATLLDLVESEQMSWEREAVALYLATQLLDGAEPPRRLVAQVRSLAREAVSPEAGVIVTLAARSLGDSETIALSSRFAPIARLADTTAIGETLLARLSAPVLDSLPENAAIEGDHPVVRADPRTGRNDPCPCGSGRKYKKCCLEHDEQHPVYESRVEQARKLQVRGRIPERVFADMRPSEISQLEPEMLTTIQLIDGYRKLARHRRWSEATRFVDALATRSDTPGGDPEGHRQELATEALRAGELDLAESLLARLTLSESAQASYRTQFALARNAPEALTELESLLRQGHEGDGNLIYDVAYTLLEHFPALGILAARGTIDPGRLLDSEMILMEIERARDRLGLPAHEPWWEVFDLLLDGGFGASRGGGITATRGSDQRRDEEIEAMRTSLQSAKSRVGELEADLEVRERRLDTLTTERERLARIVGATRGDEERKRVDELEEEQKRLRTKIVALKGEISEGAAQRAELRRELAVAADSRKKEATPRGTPQESEAAAAEADEAEDGRGASAPKNLLIPRYSAAAASSLGRVPARVGRDALETIALLAGGVAQAWHGVKHLRRAHEVLSARIGRSYRLLFRIDGRSLEVVELIHRGELEAEVNRLTGR